MTTAMFSESAKSTLDARPFQFQSYQARSSESACWRQRINLDCFRVPDDPDGIEGARLPELSKYAVAAHLMVDGSIFLFATTTFRL